jgi:precorrin-6A synthase
VTSPVAATVRVVGFGMGPQHVTPEAADALRASSYVVAAAKREDDPLLAVRRAVANAHGLEVVAVPDPERERDPDDYDRAVRAWHEARSAAYRDVIATRPGDPAFLVWGDPSLYDSTIRVVSALGMPYEVVAGISAPQLLAARHGIVLHEVGGPVHVTTARRLRTDIAAGATNIVVMLTAGVELDGLKDWTVWWGANLGAASERLVAGRVSDVVEELVDARSAARTEAGWVMDLFLLRAPS